MAACLCWIGWFKDYGIMLSVKDGFLYTLMISQQEPGSNFTSFSCTFIFSQHSQTISFLSLSVLSETSIEITLLHVPSAILQI